MLPAVEAVVSMIMKMLLSLVGRLNLTTMLRENAKREAFWYFGFSLKDNGIILLFVYSQCAHKSEQQLHCLEE